MKKQNCIYGKQLMKEALAGTLTSHHQQLWEEHLNTCGVCAAEYNALQETVTFMQQQEIPQPTTREWQDFHRNLRQAVHVPDLSHHGRIWRYRRVLVPVAAVIIIALTLAIVLPISKQSSTEISATEVDYYVEKALVQEYIVQQLDLEELYQQDTDYASLEQRLEELEEYL